MSFAPTSVPNNLTAIRQKIRKITARPSPNRITDNEIDDYINTFYLYDMPKHLWLESLKYNYEFTTSANLPVYDFPTDTYVTEMAPVYIGGYQSYMTQSRDNFFRINPQLNFLQQTVYTGNGTVGPYTGNSLTQTPIIPGFKPNPPGAYVANAQYLLPASQINWNVVVSAKGAPDATSGISPSLTLVDDGLGHLIDPNDDGTTASTGYVYRGTVNYITGEVSINSTGFTSLVPNGNSINAQFIPYVASRPQSVVFFQDQMIVYPVPDQAYTVSFEAYKMPTAFLSTNLSSTPQVKDWWQLLAYGAADKIFSDSGDLESMQKYRPLLEEQMNLVQRRSIQQQTSERVATIYTQQNQFPSYPFGNLFGGF